MHCLSLSIRSPYSNLGTAIGHHTVTEDYQIASESMAVRQPLAKTHRSRHIRHHRGRTSHEESLALRHVPNLAAFHRFWNSASWTFIVICWELASTGARQAQSQSNNCCQRLMSTPIPPQSTSVIPHDTYSWNPEQPSVLTTYAPSPETIVRLSLQTLLLFAKVANPSLHPDRHIRP